MKLDKISDLELFLETTRLNHGDLPVVVEVPDEYFESLNTDFFKISEEQRLIDLTGSEFVSIPKRLEFSVFF